MPLLKHAKKKLRQDKKRTLRNKKVRELYKEMLKKAKAHPTKENISAAFSSIDKAAKENLMHENKAARLKSSLTKASKGSKESESNAAGAKGDEKATTTKGKPARSASSTAEAGGEHSAKSEKAKATTKKATVKKATKKAAK